MVYFEFDLVKAFVLDWLVIGWFDVYLVEIFGNSVAC